MADRQYMFDPTNSQWTTDGQWAFGFYRLGAKDANGAWVVTKQNGDLQKYTERNDMFYTIQRQG